MPAEAAVRALYVEARSALASGTGLNRARDLFARVTESSPGFAPAHAYLAETGTLLALGDADREAETAARRATRRALALDPTSAPAHRASAMIALVFDWRPHGALRALERAFAADPEAPANHLVRASYLSILGRHEEALADVRRAVDLDPGSMAVRSDAGYFLLRAGRWAEAAEACEMVLRLAPGQSFARACLVTAYGRTGRPERTLGHALELMREAGAEAPALERVRTAADPRHAYLAWSVARLEARDRPPPVQIAAHRLALGDSARALDWLERAARDRSRDLVFVAEGATFAPLRDRPRFRRALESAGLGHLLACVSHRVSSRASGGA